MNQTDDGEEVQLNLSPIYESYAIENYVLIALYIPLIIVALSANFTVIIIVAKNRYMRKISNYFLVNLSIADLLVTLVCMPNAMWRAYSRLYYFGEYTCKISVYVECVAVGSSIFTITAMAMHRYLAITNPLFGRMYRIRCSISLIMASLWLSSMFVFSPILSVYKLKEFNIKMMNKNLTLHFCHEDWTDSIVPQHLMGILWFTFVFAVPGFIMLVAYSTMGRTLCSDAPLFDDDSTTSYQRQRLIRSRKKVACILLLLALVFAICWLPKHIVNLMDDTESVDESSDTGRSTIKPYLLLLGHMNSALNPVIYCALSRKFRNSIQKLCCKRSCVAQRELTRVTLIRLNTMRNANLNNSRSATQTLAREEIIRYH